MRGLARLLEALGDDADELRQALTDDADLALRLARVLGASAALGDHLASHPARLARAGRPEPDPAPTDRGRHRPRHSARPTDRDELRLVYRRLLLRLAARDLSLDMRVDDAAAELADLASGAIEAALAIARREVGEPADAVHADA